MFWLGVNAVTSRGYSPSVKVCGFDASPCTGEPRFALHCRRSQLRTTRSLLLCRISCGFAKKWAKISANFLQKAIDFCDLKLYTLKHKIILEKGSTDDEKAYNEHGKIL